ncbi:L,D-transpeptidase [Fuscovulum ytuae]|uniref:L,D-transpeptidase n=1 Tax=Fuscovulum ytuae TaxID=3042299 RepID=A0ABY8Q9R0_9RHOB|nr:L,D-transpeptidase [Fuscovulum sp. YMD61]WGV17434.1 L,D-transpeptidase [Fuscovulum sp. YMD61]
MDHRFMRAPFPAVFKTFAALALATILSACVHEGGTTMSNVKPGEPKLVEGAYLATKDANIDIPALPVEEIPQQFRRQSVYFETAEAPGTIIINPSQRVLHYVTGKNQAIRYGISVGRAGFEWAGTAIVNEKKPWPTWTPPKEMIARDPKLAKWEKGQPGGPTNPLGARAIYLTTNGVDYGYRIHGTPEWRSIGRNASSGCIRMINQDVIDLYNRLQGGEKVVVLTRDGEYPTRLILPPPTPVKKVEPAPVVVPAAMPSFNPLLQGVPPALQAPAATTPSTTAPSTTTTTTTNG